MNDNKPDTDDAVNAAREKAKPVGRNPLRRIFTQIKQRCNNPRKSCYHNYGGRGIRCNFTSFEEFASAIGPRPTSRHTVERVDNDGHYEPGNVRWATRKEQAINTRVGRVITVDGVSLKVRDWAKKTGVRHSTINLRLRRLGWCERCAVTLPAVFPPNCPSNTMRCTHRRSGNEQ